MASHAAGQTVADIETEFGALGDQRLAERLSAVEDEAAALPAISRFLAR